MCLKHLRYLSLIMDRLQSACNFLDSITTVKGERVWLCETTVQLGYCSHGEGEPR